MTRSLVVVGAGGFGRETLDVVRARLAVDPHSDYELLGVVDDAPSSQNLERLAAAGIDYLGDTSLLDTRSELAIVIAVGDPLARLRLAERWSSPDRDLPAMVHPTATVGTASTVGRGVVVCAGAQVSTNVSLGDFVHVNPNATIGHDSRLAPGVSVNPGAVVSGEVTIDRGALIGAGAVVLQGLTIGAGATVGAAACVVRDVAAGVVVKGVPAR